ncbi:MAG: ABC transporter substrate-binding protein [Candidatus Pacebacteria bacterium]|nr:ABC transporter substrate-binding protein [Candidatus Paceibacterota bacterium]
MSYLKGVKKLTTLRGWKQFFKILDKREKIIFLTSLFFFCFTSIYLSSDFYFNNTEKIAGRGGYYVEGLLRSPRLIINPVSGNLENERDLAQLIYSGLMKYDDQGKLKLDLAKEYKILEGGRIFEFYLKDNLFWSDGKPLNADDVIFTLKTIQNPSSNSFLRANWLGVKVEKISETGIRFELSNPSSVFLDNSTFGILPKNIWEDQNFLTSIYNLKPVGSGPYKLKNLVSDIEGNITSAELVVNPYYSGKAPNISNLKFLFFKNEDELIRAFKSGKVQGISFFPAENYQRLEKENASRYQLSLPVYFALFFNSAQSEILKDKDVRMALNHGTNKDEIIEKALPGQASAADSPILPDIYGFKEPGISYQYDIQKAKELLDKAGFVENENGLREKIIKKTPSFQFKSDLKLGARSEEVKELQKCLAKDSSIYPDGEVSGYFGEKTKKAVIKFQEKYKDEILTPSGLTQGNGMVLRATRAKLNDLCAAPSEKNLALSFTLATVNQPTLIKVAEILKEQWKALGISLDVQTYDNNVSTLKPNLEQEVIKPRNYQILLFGEVLSSLPDPFPFWHSSQIKDPGLNLSGYENKNGDKLLEENRRSLDETERKESLEEFQNLLLADAPAVFLYSPGYIYLVSNEIKGIETETIVDSSKRFSSVENWYIKTKRAWK